MCAVQSRSHGRGCSRPPERAKPFGRVSDRETDLWPDWIEWHGETGRVGPTGSAVGER